VLAAAFPARISGSKGGDYHFKKQELRYPYPCTHQEE
jgi:hypothetical protein